ncbi:unnamed protein product [Paramecium sonneborni]|uniref:Transmembrane protein n=1 Tax=Paramecium sonneborni TaxID=65129 RepID=A0A8S1R0G9_9CILI|nr:unnamed protein product [Paramecium sonneborni]
MNQTNNLNNSVLIDKLKGIFQSNKIQYDKQSIIQIVRVLPILIYVWARPIQKKQQAKLASQVLRNNCQECRFQQQDSVLFKLHSQTKRESSFNQFQLIVASLRFIEHKCCVTFFFLNNILIKLTNQWDLVPQKNFKHTIPLLILAKSLVISLSQECLGPINIYSNHKNKQFCPTILTAQSISIMLKQKVQYLMQLLPLTFQMMIFQSLQKMMNDSLSSFCQLILLFIYHIHIKLLTSWRFYRRNSKNKFYKASHLCINLFSKYEQIPPSLTFQCNSRHQELRSATFYKAFSLTDSEFINIYTQYQIQVALCIHSYYQQLNKLQYYISK